MVSGNRMYSIEYILGQNWVRIWFFPSFFCIGFRYIGHYRLSSVILILTYIRLCWSIVHSSIFWFAKKIFSIFSKMYSMEYIFIWKSYVDSAPEKSKMKWKSIKKKYSNIKVISEVWHIYNIFLSVLYNIMETLKIVSCLNVSNFSHFNTKP